MELLVLIWKRIQSINMKNWNEINQECMAALYRLGVKRPETDLSRESEAQHCKIELDVDSEVLQDKIEKQCEMDQTAAHVDTWLGEVTTFIKSYDFMRLGQAMGHGQWQSAAMTIRRMDMQAKKLGAECFLRQFAGLKQAVARKNAQEAKQILVSVTAKRVKIIEALNERERVLRDE